MRAAANQGGAHRASRGSATAVVSALGASAAVGAATAVATHFARLVLTPSAKPDDRVEVLGVTEEASSPSGERVWLCGPEADLEGSYSFIFDADSRLAQHLAGHVRLGPVVATDRVRGRVRVARDVLEVLRGELRTGARGRITGWWFAEPEQLGYEVQRIALPLPNGVGWGWVIRPEHPLPGRWAVHVHGRGALPHETLRGVPPFARAGVTSLVIAYRNDPGAPAGVRGRYGLGISESEDVEAAIGWTLCQGADRVTLVGWSMGATACVLASTGRHRRAIDGMVLDSPALDWADVLRNQARLARLPQPVGALAALLLRTGLVRGAVPGLRGTDLEAISGNALSSLVQVPTLVHAGAGDTFVPWDAALRLARTRSRFVRLRPARGEHVKHWNVDPEGWEAETAQFIREL